jgi:gluconokinase
VDAAGMHIAAVATYSCWPDPPSPGPGLAVASESDWCSFKDAAWLPPISEGAALCAGSGSLGPERFSLAFGAAGGVRALLNGGSPPPSLADFEVSQVASRVLLEHRLSGAGATIEWMKRVLALPRGLEARLDSSIPGSHGVTLLPFVENRGAISGFSLATEAFDLLLAAFDSVALRGREACDSLAGLLGPPREVIASGPALLNSPASVQMMADALGRDVIVCIEPEPAARGAALLALEHTGAIPGLTALPAPMGSIFQPREYQRAAYEALADRERALLQKLS